MTFPSVVVAAGLVVDGDRVLLARRRPGDHLAGRWEFPGGKVRPTESVPSALARELHEELGVRAEPGALWGIVRHRYPEREVCIHFHFVEILEGTPRPHAAASLKWATPPEMEHLPFPEADRSLVEELIRCHRRGIPLRQSRQELHPGNGEDSA